MSSANGANGAAATGRVDRPGRRGGSIPGARRPASDRQADHAPGERGASHMTFRISSLAVAALASAALAAPAGAATFTATVRVEGQDQTLLPTTTVTLDTAAPKSVQLKDKDCDGDTAAAALDQATKGNWDRTQFPSTILAETHQFSHNDYWAEWVDEKYAQMGIC